MRVVAKSGLQKFWERPGCADARGPLHSWYVEAVGNPPLEPRGLEVEFFPKEEVLHEKVKIYG